MEDTQDVNTGAESSSAPDHVAENTEAQPSPGEALNQASENKAHEEYVPYDRFQEAILAKQELEARFQSPDWQGYERLKAVMDQDPGLAQRVIDSVADYLKGGQQQPYQAPEGVDPNLASQLLPMQQAISQLYQERQQNTFNRYDTDFNSKLSEAKVPDHWKDFYREKMIQVAGQLNPNALNMYDNQLIKRAFDTVDVMARSLQRAERAAYIQDKKSDNVPASTSSTGVPGAKVPRLVTTDDRAALALEIIRAGA